MQNEIMQKEIIQKEIIQLEQQTIEVLGVVTAVNCAVNYGTDDFMEYISALRIVERILRRHVTILKKLNL